ncbi:UNVERIFIED_CONTAM: zinc finger protein [Trichonephila clavipes]
MFKAIKRLILSGLKPHTCKLCNDCYVCHACMRERNQIRQCCYGVSEDELDILHEELRKNFNLLYPKRENSFKNDSDEDVSQCGKNTSQNCSVNSDGWDSLKCSMCGKIFKTEFTLTRHFNAHVKAGEKYKCKTCEKCFANNQDLGKHTKIHKTVEDKSRICMYCEKAFSSYYYLKIHIRRHTGERPFICELCNSGFTTKSILKIHYRTHDLQSDAVQPLTKSSSFDSDGEISNQQEFDPNIYEELISYKDFICGELDSETSNDEVLNLSLEKNSNLILDDHLGYIGSESVIVNHQEYNKLFHMNKFTSDAEPVITEKDHYKSPFVIKLKSAS